MRCRGQEQTGGGVSESKISNSPLLRILEELFHILFGVLVHNFIVLLALLPPNLGFLHQLLGRCYRREWLEDRTEVES